MNLFSITHFSFNADRHRRRRKEEELPNPSQTQQQNNLRSSSSAVTSSTKQNLPASNSPQPPSSQGQGQVQGQFDLEANAFPPLPGIEAGMGIVVKTVPVEGVPNDNNSQTHWGENRLADVVKGTAKPKSNSGTKDKEDGGNNSPRPLSPIQLPQTPTPTAAVVSPAVKSSTGAATDVSMMLNSPDPFIVRNISNVRRFKKSHPVLRWHLVKHPKRSIRFR